MLFLASKFAARIVQRTLYSPTNIGNGNLIIFTSLKASFSPFFGTLSVSTGKSAYSSNSGPRQHDLEANETPKDPLPSRLSLKSMLSIIASILKKTHDF